MRGDVGEIRIWPVQLWLLHVVGKYSCLAGNGMDEAVVDSSR